MNAKEEGKMPPGEELRPARHYMAHKLRELRVKKGFTLDDVGAAAGKHYKTVSSWERAEGLPDADTLVLLCHLFGVDISVFYGGKHPEVSLFREQQGLTSDELAKKLGIDPDLYEQWEQNGDQLPLDDLLRISHFASVPLESLVEDSVAVLAAHYADIRSNGEKSYGTPPYHYLPSQLYRAYPESFYYTVPDESINLSIPKGCYALVNPLQGDVPEGKLLLLSVGDEPAILRRVTPLLNGYSLKPHSSDPTINTMVLDFRTTPRESIVFHGEAVWFTAPLDYAFPS